MATIDTNMSLVMIDPNEPLELYDGTIIKGRLEWFLYALCCLDYGNLPTPLSRIEEWANALITNELPNMEPQSRAEEFFKAILTGDTSNLPTPQSRSEVLLDKLARGENDFTNVEKIQSRYEFLLAYLIKNGGGIGNIDYVLYKFQKEDETLYNTKERPVKSAILKGQTLVNLVPKKNIDYTASSDWDGFQALVQNSSQSIDQWRTLQDLKPNTKYYISCYVETFDASEGQIYRLNNPTNKTTAFKEILEVKAIGLHKWVLTSRTEFTEEIFIALRCQNYNARGAIKIRDIMIIEYQEGMENWDIPYFEGMQSVKMPVLKTTGKNLFDDNTVFKQGYVNYMTGGITMTSNATDMITDYIPFSNAGEFTISYDGDKRVDIVCYDSNKNYINGVAGNGSVVTITEKTAYIVVMVRNISNVKNRVQIEKGTQVTPYEPYKTNILTASEDVTLRGIGDVRDTLDCITREKVERISEVVLNGSENWQVRNFNPNNTECTVFTINFADKLNSSSLILCDKMPFIGKDVVAAENVEGIYGGGGSISFFINVSNSKATTVEEFKSWLSTNNVTIQYLKTPTIKTVDLSIVDQGGATIPKLNTFDKITHVNVSATDILPGVEMEVATTVGEDLSGTLYSTMEDIETKQEALKESNNAQTESVNSTMMASTEIYESLL